MSEDDYEPASELIAAIAMQERRVLCFLLTHRTTAEPIAKAAGLNVEHFQQDDYRIIYAGWEVACEEKLSQVRTLSLIRRGLQEEGLWDPSAIRASTGMRHSDATLAAMACTPVTKEELADAFAAVGIEGDWHAFVIARHINALVGVYAMGVCV